MYSDPRDVRFQAEGRLEPLGEDARHRQQDQQQREGEDEVHHPAERGVQPAARVTGDDADRDTDGERDECPGEGDQQRDPRAVEQPGEQVTAGARLDAEGVLQADPAPATGGQAARVVDRLGVELQRVDADDLGDQRGKDGDQDDEHDERHAEHRDLVAAEAAPCDLGQGATGDLALLGSGAGWGLDSVVGCKRHLASASSPRTAGPSPGRTSPGAMHWRDTGWSSGAGL